MLVDLKGIFTPQAVAATLERLPDLATTVLDAAFPKRPTWPFPVVGLGELTPITGTVPVVRRGGQPVTVGNNEIDVMMIAPQPVKPAVEVSASELNDVKMLLSSPSGGNAVEMWRQNKIDALRRLVRDTSEAMASIVLYQGKVDWPQRKDGGGTSNYVVDYGPPLTYAPAQKLSGSSKVSEIYKLLLAMRAQVRQAGVGGRVEFHAGEDVFSVLLDVCQGYASTVKGESIRVELSGEQGVIQIGGFKIMLMDEVYKHPVTGQWISKLNAKTLIAFATDVNGTVWYCAVDSISAGNPAVPFYVVPEVMSGDGGIRLIAQSKPLPARNSKTVCRAVVVD